MSTKILQTCDLCQVGEEKEVRKKNRNEIFTIRLFVDSCQQDLHHRYESGKLNAEWCRECCEKKGLLPKYAPDHKHIPAEPATLDDLVRDMLQDMVSEGLREIRDR